MYYNSAYGTGILGYINFVLSYHSLLFHLVSSDLRARFRRTYLGIIWAIILPLAFASALAFLFSEVFKQPWQDLLLYIYTGTILWEIITTSVNRGSDSFIEASVYIKQNCLPTILFPIRVVISAFVYFLISFSGLFILALVVKPEIITVYWFYIEVFLVSIVFFSAPIAIICAYINCRMRDFQPISGIILQFMSFLSPIFIDKSVYISPKMLWFSSINPFFSLCNLLRDPILYARAPALHDMLVVLIWGTMLWIIGILIAKTIYNKIVYYI